MRNVQTEAEKRENSHFKDVFLPTSTLIKCRLIFGSIKFYFVWNTYHEKLRERIHIYGKIFLCVGIENIFLDIQLSSILEGNFLHSEKSTRDGLYSGLIVFLVTVSLLLTFSA